MHRLKIHLVHTYLETFEMENSLSDYLSEEDSKGATRFLCSVSAERHPPLEPGREQKHGKGAVNSPASGDIDRC